jgi:S1-C subfamily serine protease/pSer/pThr/pTyr-binding forkhead associated (FHA) protein
MRLTFTEGDRPGRSVEIDADRFTVGRAEDNDLRLPDPEKRVSRHHAEIVHRDGDWFIRDLDSSNGVWIDGRRIEQETLLRDGQSVRVGGQRFTVRLEGPTAGADTAEDVAKPTPAPAPTPRIRPRKPVPPMPVQDKPRQEQTKGPDVPPAAGSGRRRMGYTTLLRRTDKRIRRVTFIAGAAVLLALVVAGLAVGGVFSGKQKQGLDIAALVRKSQASVVFVTMKVDHDLGQALGLDNDRISSGSGWVLDASSGDIITNAHVAAGGQKATVALSKGSERDARVVGMNYCHDVALMRTGATAGLTSLQTVSQPDLSAGDPVVALGFPGSLSPDDNLVTTTGVVSVVKTSALDSKMYPDVVQTDAAINHGNSGGPLLNADGKVVGINTLTDINVQNENFAISSDHVNQLLPEMRRGVSTGWLGYDLQDAHDDNTPQIVLSDGTKFYGPQIFGPAAGTSVTGGLDGAAGGKQQYVYAFNGVKFGPGDKDLSQSDVQGSTCRVAGDKKTGDTVNLGIVEVGAKQADGSRPVQTYDVTVKYR